MSAVGEPVYGSDADALRDRLYVSDARRAYNVTAARKLLADIKAQDYADERHAYRLLGAAEVVIASLVEIIENA